MVSINRLKQQKEDSDMPKWTTPERIYLSEDGQVVDEAAPGRKTLLAPAGKEITDAVCRRYVLGPYAEPAGGGPDEDEETTDPESVGSCCTHAFRVHRKEDGLCGQRRHCGCQGWQPEQPGDEESKGASDNDDGSNQGKAE